jgi:predicted transcriptional regulator
MRLVAAAFLPSPEQGAAITAASALAGLLYWLWPTIKGGAAGLFSRVTGPKLLEHPARARLVQLVQAEPGVHFQDLVRRSGLPNGTAVHHLHKLADAGLVAARPLGRYTCYFPGPSPDRASLAAAPVTRSDGARRILAELTANPGLSGTDLAVRLGLQASTVTYHVKRLQEAGLVAAARDGRVIRLRTVAGAA